MDDSTPTGSTPDDILALFALEVRTAREARGLSRESFAKRCGLSLTTVKRVEYGNGPHPRLETLIRLADGLDVALADLIACVDPRRSDTHKAKIGATNVWMSSLGEPQQELVYAIIRVLAMNPTTAGERTVKYAA